MNNNNNNNNNNNTKEHTLVVLHPRLIEEDILHPMGPVPLHLQAGLSEYPLSLPLMEPHPLH